MAAVDDISLEVRRGEILGIIGRSGAGKSTLIRCINGLEQTDKGEILFDGMPVGVRSRQNWHEVQRKIGMIFQHFNLLSSRKIIDNVALPLKIGSMPGPKRRARALEMLDLVGLADKAEFYPAQLSGGQKQRVGIARALASHPSLLLSDEATSALDPETTNSILDLLGHINQQMHLTIMLVTHEMEVIRKLANRVIVLDKGRIVEEGTVRDIIANPISETARSLLASSLPQLPRTFAARLRPQPEVANNCEVVIEMHLDGAHACSPFLHHIYQETGLVARILQGGIEHVQGAAMGHFFLAAPASSPERLDLLNTWLQINASSSKVLGFVHI